METVSPATDMDQSSTLHLSIAAGLRDLAAMVEANPHLADHLRYAFDSILVSDPRTRDEVTAFARAGMKAGAKVTKHQNDKYAGVDVHFGPVVLHVYVDRDEVCERIVVGTRDVTEEVPDPEALAAVPKVTVTKTVEDVEWRCLPLLADVSPAGAL